MSQSSDPLAARRSSELPVSWNDWKFWYEEREDAGGPKLAWIGVRDGSEEQVEVVDPPVRRTSDDAAEQFGRVAGIGEDLEGLAETLDRARAANPPTDLSE